MDLISWLESLKVAEVSPEGFTTREVASTLGITDRKARDMLREAFRRGRIIRVGFKLEEGMDGRTCYRIPVYQYAGGKNAEETYLTASPPKEVPAARSRKAVLDSTPRRS